MTGLEGLQRRMSSLQPWRPPAGVIGGWSGVCGSNTQRQLSTSAVLGVPVGNEVELNWANSLLAVVRK